MAKAGDIVEGLCAAAREGDPVAVSTIVDHFDRRSIGAFIAVPALLEITPIGGIPGLPTALALFIALMAVQIAIGREDLWLPGFLARRTIHEDKVEAAAEKLRPLTDWMDRHLGRHLVALTKPPMQQAAALMVIVLCLTVPFLEIVPFASTIPMATIAMFGLGLLTGDGRLMALAWTLSLAALGVAFWAFVLR
ncbi:exopolysaccharide biosynthesis protein [Jannaschia sp. Os4]|uniref:exopolysaccharide biosynthesis protein n=1 Tax=Jannaschia sp. Os4 TaxID=2807617 RepID=UPI00193A5A9B|nr:exopolysaccharide biosynthesis protein [Jannaschia sp. Os4]MBM2577351.1 exopolysaccharide biosynthesis protein [Jannaschia sp. Os4]